MTSDSQIGGTRESKGSFLRVRISGEIGGSEEKKGQGARNISFLEGLPRDGRGGRNGHAKLAFI